MKPTQVSVASVDRSLFSGLWRRVFPHLSPMSRRRIQRFRSNRRAYWSLILFVLLSIASFSADLIANDRPLFVWYDGRPFFPIVEVVSETVYGGFFETEADYNDPEVARLIEEKGFLVRTPIPFRFDTPSFDSGTAPAPPSWRHWLGTDDQARDVVSRTLHGLKLSILFGFAVTVISSVIGVFVAAVQGYFGGWVDLIGQRFIEVWSSMPSLFILIILASTVTPNFWWLLLIVVAFGWPTLSGVVRAESLRVRKLDYVRAARALGVSHMKILWRHLAPNALVAALTFLPFIASGSLVALTSLDFLGFGLPPGSPSLGNLLKQGKEHLDSPWLGITAFVTLTVLLSLLLFVGEGVRDAFDPRGSASPAKK